tara:strand:- start:81 stop:521 length:441 start_codon:yes stop_codon:yes gene_type:complete
MKYILQSKRGNLEKEFKKLNFNKNSYISGGKGDFSHLQNSNLIISIGWQSIALKAASAFNKPLIFYSKYEYPYKDYIFSINQKKNKLIDNLCSNLWITEEDLNNKFNGLFLDNQKFIRIKNISEKFLKELHFYQGDIEDYFLRYFK